MKSGFSDPIAIKEKKEGKNPWNFKAPPYDERSSSFVSAGSDYGVGHRQPVGHKEGASERASTMPMGKVNTMKTDRE